MPRHSASPPPNKSFPPRLTAAGTAACSLTRRAASSEPSTWHVPSWPWSHGLQGDTAILAVVARASRWHGHPGRGRTGFKPVPYHQVRWSAHRKPQHFVIQYSMPVPISSESGFDIHLRRLYTAHQNHLPIPRVIPTAVPTSSEPIPPVIPTEGTLKAERSG